MKHPVCILGGGVAGLTAAIYSGAPVYEADDRAGGVALSDKKDGFTFDRGIHILQSSQQVVLDLLDQVGVRFASRERSAFIYSHKAYTPYPFQVNTAHLPIGLRAKCVYDFLSRPKSGKPTNYDEWIRQSVGESFADTFLIPYSEKFWTVHPREMTCEWTSNRVPQPTTKQVLRGAIWSKQTRIGTNSVFRYPEGSDGYGAVPAALQRAASDQVHTGYRAVSLDPVGKTVRFQNGSTVSYDALISTIPLPELIRICQGAPADVKQAVSRLRTNSILVVNLGIGQPGISDRHWVHFPERDVSFFRISYPHNLHPDVVPPGASSVSAEVAYSPDRPIDKATIVDRVIDDLIRVRAIGPRDPIVLKTVYDVRYAYCIYDMQRQESLRTIFKWLRSHDITPAGRYGLWTYFWSDEAMLSGKKAAETVAQKVAVLS